nr:PREDICTED: uncharacterized protein LOC107075608 [Lepisosteus oculatus]
MGRQEDCARWAVSALLDRLPPLRALLAPSATAQACKAPGSVQSALPARTAPGPITPPLLAPVHLGTSARVGPPLLTSTRHRRGTTHCWGPSELSPALWAPSSQTGRSPPVCLACKDTSVIRLAQSSRRSVPQDTTALLGLSCPPPVQWGPILPRVGLRMSDTAAHVTQGCSAAPLGCLLHRGFVPLASTVLAGPPQPPRHPRAHPCPPGTWSNAVGAHNESSCWPCPAGFFCNGTGLRQATGLCAPGFYCLRGATSPMPLDGVTGDKCPPGYHCPQGTAVPQPCQDGTFSNTTGINFRNPDGNISTGVGGPCPQGHFCPAGTSLPLPCPLGSFSDRSG